jgi:hypothetical protein
MAVAKKKIALRVISGGLRALHDPDGLLKRLARIENQPT